MNRQKIGPLVVFILALLNVVIWLTAGPENLEARTDFQNQYWGEILASTSMILMAIGFILASRPSYLEDWFGGLDKMFKIHKMANIVAIWLIIGHFATIPESGDEGIGPKLGMMAFIGMILLVLITLAPKTPLKRVLNLPYHKWKITHKFLGLFYIVGIVHTFAVDNIIKHAEIASLYCRVIVFLGALAWIYKTFLYQFVKKHYSYEVSGLNKLSNDTVEIVMNPIGEKLQHSAGQFLFIGFEDKKELKESHPFTISSSPQSDELCVSIKASGDFTKKLQSDLNIGMKATLDGPYGRFDYKSGAEDQVWIAGGIGITPFLSWIRALDPNDTTKINFFYCTKNKEEAHFLEEIISYTEIHPSVQLHPIYSDDQGHLKADTILKLVGGYLGKDIYLCGPPAMTQSLKKQFLKSGVSKSNIHYDEFNFR